MERHPVDQRGERLRLGAAMGFASLAPVAYETRLLEDAQVLGNRRLRDARAIGQNVHGELAVAC